MKGKYLMGIDVGTTGTKVMIFDLDGRPVSTAYQEYGCTYPHPNWVEQDCNMLIEAVYACCAEAVGGDLDAHAIAGISVSAQRSCTVFLDGDGAPLNMISWLDNRATEQVEEIAATIGRERFYEITGLPLSTTWILPKLLHTRRHNPTLWAKTAKVTQLQDLILRAMGVEGYYSNEPEGSFYGLWDNRNFCFSEELLSRFGIDRGLLPEVKQAGTTVGAITPAVAARTGLAVGTPICVGIGDQNSAALGAGIVKPGWLSVSLGTGGLATALLDTCYRDPAGQAMTTNHAIHGLWTFEGLQNAAAGAFRWFRDEIAALEKRVAEEQEENAFDTLTRMLAGTPVGAKGLLMLPYFAGSAAPRWNPQAKGGFLGLTFAHDRACMARACVEGITLEQKDIIKSVTRDGASFELVRIVGGATKSEVWNQLQADVYGLPCETLEVRDAAVLGAAICAGVGTGVFGSFEEGVSHMVRISRRYEPNLENAEKYEKLYQVYCNVYSALEGANIFAQLEQI